MKEGPSATFQRLIDCVKNVPVSVIKYKSDQVGKLPVSAWPYVFGLIGACASVPVGAGLARSLCLGQDDQIMSFALLFWLAPMPYLAAWLALSCPFLLRSLLSILLLAIANVFLVYLGLSAGFLSFGLLALPAIIGCSYLIGLALVPLQDIGGLDFDEAWLRIHGRGCLLAGLALVFAFTHRLYTPLISDEVQPTALQSAGRGVLIYFPVWFSFLWHARAAWAELRIKGQAPPNLSRACIVVLGAFILSFWLFAALPGGVSLMGGHRGAWVRPPPGTPACLADEWPYS